MVKLLVVDEKLKEEFKRLQTNPKDTTELVGAGKPAENPGKGAPAKGMLLQFKLPSDKQKRMFLMQDSILYELQHPTMGKKTSWFMDDSVVEDGSFYLATPFQV